MSTENKAFELDSDDDYNECILDSNNDRRLIICDSPNKSDDIIHCIGSIETQYIPDPNTKQCEKIHGTGTAIHIDPNHNVFVLTAAHNILVQERQCQNCNTKTINTKCPDIQCANKTKKTGNLIKPTHIYFSRRGHNTNNLGEDIQRNLIDDYMIPKPYNDFPTPKSGYDICIIMFKCHDNDSIHLYKNYCSKISLINDETFGGNKLHLYIYGYPGETPEVKTYRVFYYLFGMGTSKCNDGNKFQLAKNSNTHKFFIINTCIDTTTGQSGSPIYSYDKNTQKYLIYGIHSGGSAKAQVNYGTFLDNDNIACIHQILASKMSIWLLWGQQHTKAICWKSVDNTVMNIQKIQFKSNKFQTVKIKKVNETHKQMLSEQKVNMSYFGQMSKGLHQLWESPNPAGKVAAPVLAVGLALFTVIPILPAAYQYDQYQESKKLNYKKERNKQSETFNDKLAEIKQFEDMMLPKLKELQKQEQILNCREFQLERFCDLYHDSRVVMTIGPSGFGKSLVANRLLGNGEDIDDISESKHCEFKVAETGSTNSVTRRLVKQSKIVRITEDNKEQSFVLSVIDTPGALDDIEYNNKFNNNYKNMMMHYFSACGGINVFAIFVKFGGRICSYYRKLIKKYIEMFGDGLWKHCCVLMTHCDMDSKKNKKRLWMGLKKTMDEIQQFVKDLSGGMCDDIRIFMFGENNFEQSRSDFLSLLINENNTFFKKYKCQNLESPIDSLYKELKVGVKQHKKLLQHLKLMSKQIYKIETDIETSGSSSVWIMDD